MIRTFRRLAIGSVAALAASLFAAPALADTAPPGSFEVDYDVVGTSTLASTGSTVDLGPTTLKTYVSTSGDGSLTGEMPLPPTQTEFDALGFLPTTATVSFIPAGQLTGQLSQQPPLTVSAEAKYYIKLSDVKMAGVPAFVGDHCQTVDPVAIAVATPEGQTFNLTSGGTLSGTYTVGKFHHCGLTTPMINLLVPGSGNTVDLQLSNGRFIP